MPSIETSIYEAIKARVATLPMVSDYPVVWSTETTYVPSPSQPYLRATWLPNTNRRLFLNGADPHQRLGLLQIDVFDKKTRPEADVVAIEVAGQVAAHFPADQTMSYAGVTAHVTKAPDVTTAIAGATHMQVPVMISIECFA